MSEPRKTFGPVVLLGLASAGLAAVAGARAWVELSAASASAGGAMASSLQVAAPGEMPLAGALSLVLLACWGVVLVTRRKARRAVAGLAVLTALALLATTIVAAFTLPDSFRGQLEAALGSSVRVNSTFTGWYAAALIAAVISVLATLAAVRYVPTWPEMGSRYDSPAGEREAPADPEDNLQLWKALDQGHDPTSAS